MATEAEREAFSRLSTSGTPVVPVIELPKLAEELSSFLPRAAGAIRAWDDKMEVWRKSILFGAGGGGAILQVGTATPAAPVSVVEAIQYHGLLDGNIHFDTVLQAPTRGSLVYGNADATTKWDELAIGASGRFLRSNGTDISWQTVAASDVTGGAALTSVSDTNMTLTVSAPGAAAVLVATSLTLAWAGVLSMARGGSNKALTAVAGAVVWTDADSMELTAAGNLGEILVSQGATSPIWLSPTGAVSHALLSTMHPDTVPATVVRGDLITGQSVTPAWARLAIDTTATRYLSNTGTANEPAWAQVNLTNGVTGTLPVGSGGTAVTSLSNVLGTTNQVNVSNGTARVIGGDVTLSLPQDIHTTATPQFLRLGLGEAASALSIVYSVDTWNSAGSKYRALQVSITNTASNADSDLQRMSVDSVVKMKVVKDGSGYFAGTMTVAGLAAALPERAVFSDAAGLLVNHAGVGYDSAYDAFSSPALRATSLGSGVVFTTSLNSGVLTVNSTNFVWNNDTFRLGIGTDGPVVAVDIALGIATRATSPAQITADQNDYAIGDGTFFRLTSDASRTITGLTGGTNGKHLIIVNAGSFNIVLANQSASSTAANRIITGTGANITLLPDERVEATYDATTLRWRCGAKVYTGSGSAAHNLLSATHSDTLAASPVRGDILIANSTPAWSKLAIGTTGKFLKTDGSDPSWQSITVSDVGSGAALTKTDDTNMTITLGGSPTTALLAATSITLAWTGTLLATKGGTGFGSYTVGDLLYADTTTTLAKLAASTSGFVLTSNGAGIAPTWQAAAGGTHAMLSATHTDTTAATVVVGDLITGQTGPVWARLAGVATGNALISGGVATAVSWGQIGLTTHVTGTLPVLNGGTGAATFTAGRVLYGNGTSAIATSANLTFTGTVLNVSSLALSSTNITTTGAFLDLTVPSTGYFRFVAGANTMFQGFSSSHASLPGNMYFDYGYSGSPASTANFRNLKDSATVLFLSVTSRVGVRNTSPTALLHIAAGTATANTAPLKFNTGTLLTTAEAGAVEFLTDKWYATITTGAARKELTLNDIALTSTRVPFATTNGRLTDLASLTFASSTLTIGTASATTGLIAFAHASSANLTKFQAGNATAAVTYTLPTADGTSGYVLSTNGSGVLSWVSAAGGGAPTDAEYIVAALHGSLSAERVLTGTTNQVIVAFTAGLATLSLPQDIHTSATPQFLRMGLGAAASSTAVLLLDGGSTTIAPLKFSSDTKQTTAVAGSMEYDGTLWFTKSNAVRYSVGGTLFHHHADVQVTDTTETDLWNDAIPANTLDVDGHSIHAVYTINFTHNVGNQKRFKVKWAGTTIFDSDWQTTTAAGSVIIRVTVMRDSSTSIDYGVEFTSKSLVGVHLAEGGSLGSLTLSNSNTLIVSGQAGASTEITGKLAYVRFDPAA